MASVDSEVYSRWDSSWGQEPQELPQEGSCAAYYPLKECPFSEPDRFRKVAEDYGAVIFRSRKRGMMETDSGELEDKIQFFVILRDGDDILGYHFTPEKCNGGFLPVRFTKQEVP